MVADGRRDKQSQMVEAEVKKHLKRRGKREGSYKIYTTRDHRMKLHEITESKHPLSGAYESVLQAFRFA
jgi:hypothetical protein